MPKSLPPIPVGVQIVDQTGAITNYFRLAWESLRTSFQFAPTVAAVQLLGQTAAIVTVAAYTTTSGGLYELTYYLRKTIADGVSSSLTVTLGWVESGAALTENQSAVTTDTTTTQQSGSKLVWADANTDLTYAVAYASNTPAKMTYRIDVAVKALA